MHSLFQAINGSYMKEELDGIYIGRDKSAPDPADADQRHLE